MKQLKAREFKPIYLLMGEEPYYIDKISEFIADNVLTPDEKAFNFLMFYGKDTDVRTIDATAKRFPMMAKYQVVIVKEAQDLKKIDELVYYASKPLASTILVIEYKYKTIPKNRKLYKAIEKNGVIFESKKLYDNEVSDWVTKYMSENGYSITPEAAILIAEFLGTDLSKIVNELDKLIIANPDNKKITPDIVEKNIGFSKDYNNFELHNAIMERNFVKANRIIRYFAQNQKEHNIIPTINSLYMLFSKILMVHYAPDKSPKALAALIKTNPYFVRNYTNAAKKYSIRKTVDIISILREYDLKSKGYGNISTDALGLLQELIFKIMN